MGGSQPISDFFDQGGWAVIQFLIFYNKGWRGDVTYSNFCLQGGWANRYEKTCRIGKKNTIFLWIWHIWTKNVLLFFFFLFHTSHNYFQNNTLNATTYDFWQGGRGSADFIFFWQGGRRGRPISDLLLTRKGENPQIFPNYAPIKCLQFF